MKKKLIILVVLTMMSFVNISCVNGQNITVIDTGGYNFNAFYDGPYGRKKQTSDGKDLYCCEFYKNIPDGKECSVDTNWNSNSHHAAVLAYIVNKDWTYRYKEIFINHYLGNKGFSYQCESIKVDGIDKSTCVGSITGIKKGDKYIYIPYNLLIYETFSNAYNKIEEFKKTVPLKSIGVYMEEDFKYVKTNGNYQGVIKIYNMATIGDETKDISDINEKYNIEFEVDGSNANDVCSITGIKKQPFPTNPTNYGNYRDDVVISCDKSVGNKNIKIIVTSNSLDQSFRYDCGTDYQKLIISTTSKRVVNLTTKIPNIPTTPEDNPECNTPECSCQKSLDDEGVIMSEPYQRIQFYKRHPEYKELKNILNFDIQDKTNACKVGKENVVEKTSCLYAEKINDDFSEMNLSSYDSAIDVGGETAYCSKSIEIKSDYSDIFTSGLSTLAGMPLFISEQPQALWTNAKIDCILYYDKSNPLNLSNNIIPDDNISKSVSDVNLMYSNLNMLSQPVNEKITSEDPYKNSQAGYYKFTKTRENEYNFNEIKYDILTGKISYLNNNQISTGNYGIVSNFEDTIGIGDMIFTYKIDGNEKKFNCPYTIGQGIITTENNKIDIEFRTIDTNNPFPGKKAGINEARRVGSNWCEMKEDGVRIESCSGLSSKNNTIANYITARNNSYNKTQEGSKYTITLTPSIIDDIRNYNLTIPYDDANLKCVDTNCISNYLTKLKNKGVLTINNSEKRNIVEKYG